MSTRKQRWCWQEGAGGPTGWVLDPPLSMWEWFGWYPDPLIRGEFKKNRTWCLRLTDSNFLQTCIGHDLGWVNWCMQHQEVHRLGSHARSFWLQATLVFAMSIPFFHWMIRCTKVLRKEHAVITRKHDSSLKFCNTLTKPASKFGSGWQLTWYKHQYN